jgi:acetoin utilization protein AcuB
MLVKGWMTSDVITVDEDTPMMKASIIMKEHNIRSLPVLNKKGKLVGILSDRDLKDASPSKATTLDVFELNYLISTISIKNIMTKHPVFVRPDETVEFAALLMLENKISSLPVLNHKDALIGIITQTDIFKVLINIMGVYAGGIQIALSLEDRPGSIKEAADLIRSYGGRIVSVLSTHETAEQGRRNVYVRTKLLAEDKIRDLVRSLEDQFVVLYTVRDLLEDVEKRRLRISA